MLVFIDESGDAGFKLTKGSSQYFVIALIIFDDELNAEETSIEIKKLRRELGKSDNFEFKFNKTKKEWKVQFLHRVKNYQFRVRVIVFNKNILRSQTFKDSKEKFYNYAVKTILEHNNDTIKDAKIRLDGLGEKAFKRELTIYLRKNLNKGTSKVMKNLKFVDSKENTLIQLADMVAGSIRRSYEKKHSDSNIYKNIIKDRIVDEWRFK